MEGDDPVVDRIHAAWDAHISALSMLDNDIGIRRAFIEVLRAERAMHEDCLKKCEQQPTRAGYIATIRDYDCRIEDEEKALAKILEKV